jgi:hypothetical protein
MKNLQAPPWFLTTFSNLGQKKSNRNGNIVLYNVTEIGRLQFHRYGKSAVQNTVVFEYLGQRERDAQTCCTESWGYSLTNKLC